MAYRQYSDDYNTCVCCVCNGVRAQLTKIFTVLDTYGWILDTYIVILVCLGVMSSGWESLRNTRICELKAIVATYESDVKNFSKLADFFEDDIWNKLPKEWRNVLSQTSPEELGEWVLGKTSSTRVWPLSLLAFRETIKLLGVNRNFNNKEIITCYGSEKKTFCKKSNNLLGSKERNIFDSKYDKIFAKSVKKKKRHEIENIAETTSECADLAKCECIIDIGAGMGHLARTLAYNFDLCVLCLEQNESLSLQARKFDENLVAMLKKKNSEISERNPRHISIKVSDSDIKNNELTKKLMNEFKENFVLNESKGGFGLIGLHTCGDLADTLLKFYATQKEARFICIVGCCYMKITSGSTETGSFGYPLSKYVSMLKNHALSYAALEVACHAIENHCNKLRTGDYQDLLVHAYRATLEKILIRKNGKTIRHSHLKNVKLKENMSFERYSMTATEILKPENQPNPSDLKTDEVSDCLKRWRDVVAFGTLRFMLATLAETAVLFDRFLYLSEQNLRPTLRAIFDPTLSPRNIVLTSCK